MYYSYCGSHDHYAKKDVGVKFNKKNKTDLNVVGVRKSGGGVRATRYKNCFDKKVIHTMNIDHYSFLPIKISKSTKKHLM